MSVYELADRIVELEKQLQESAMNYISICSQADEHYARVQELEKELKRYKMAWNMAENELEKQTKPLTDEEIESIGRNLLSYWDSYDEGLILFAKAIEERHGIK